MKYQNHKFLYHGHGCMVCEFCGMTIDLDDAISIVEKYYSLIKDCNVEEEKSTYGFKSTPEQMGNAFQVMYNRMEVERLRKLFKDLAQMMKHYEVPVEMGKIILKESGK